MMPMNAETAWMHAGNDTGIHRTVSCMPFRIVSGTQISKDNDRGIE